MISFRFYKNFFFQSQLQIFHFIERWQNKTMNTQSLCNLENIIWLITDYKCLGRLRKENIKITIIRNQDQVSFLVILHMLQSIIPSFLHSKETWSNPSFAFWSLVFKLLVADWPVKCSFEVLCIQSLLMKKELNKEKSYSNVFWNSFFMFSGWIRLVLWQLDVEKPSGFFWCWSYTI